jgi:hypothetical protein
MRVTSLVQWVTRPSRLLSLGWLGALVLGCPRLLATLVVPLSIEQLADQAQLVVRGKVQQSTVDRDDAGRIYTRIELEVIEVWKGTFAGSKIEIEHGGGRLGNRTVYVSGQVSYPLGQEVVAFLVFNPRGRAVTLGLAQGKFEVWTDPLSGRKLARNFLHGQALRSQDGIESVGATAAGELLLEELKRRVRGGTQ